MEAQKSDPPAVAAAAAAEPMIRSERIALSSLRRLNPLFVISASGRQQRFPVSTVECAVMVAVALLYFYCASS
jgi:hypothetical protein